MDLGEMRTIQATHCQNVRRGRKLLVREEFGESNIRYIRKVPFLIFPGLSEDVIRQFLWSEPRNSRSCDTDIFGDSFLKIVS